MLNDSVTVLTNLFRMYIIWRFAGIFLDVEQTGRKKQFIGYGIFYLVNSGLFILFHSPRMNVVVNLLGTYGLFSVLYKGYFVQRLLAVGTMYGIGMAADAAVVLLINPDHVAGKPIIPLASIAAILVALILELICEYSIKNKWEFKAKGILRLLNIPLISISIVFYMVKYYAEYSELVMIISGGIMLINIVVLYYYNQIQTPYEEEYKQQLLKRQVQEYQMQLEQMKRTGQEIRKMKHEIKHFAFVLEAEMRKYHVKGIEEMLSEMKIVVSDYEEVSWSGDPVLDSILNFMQEKAKQAGAVIDMNIKVPEGLPLKKIDMNIILGNLLENAIEAVESKEDKKILLSMKYDRGMLFIQVCNCYDGIVRVKDGRYLTKKADKENHGIGLENIRRAVEKYDGILEINPLDNEFQVKIMITCK